MKKNILSTQSAIGRSIDGLRMCIDSNNVYAPTHIPQIVFVCGANRYCENTGKSFPSRRREEFLRFLRTTFPHVHPFLAENVFNKLLKMGKKNILKLEQDLFDLSDNVAIILESNSSFCELGAFSHQESLRKKLLIINDERYEKSPSFINEGPLDLISTENTEKSVFWYSMGDITTECDSIADIYSDVETLINSRTKLKRAKVKFDLAKLSKNTMLFIRDLITLSGPISGKELIEVMKRLFGNQDFKEFHTIVALLESIGLICLSEKLYYSTSEKLFFDYETVDISNFKSCFKVYALREGRL